MHSTTSEGHKFFRLLVCVAALVAVIFTYRYAENIAAGKQEFAPDFQVFFHAAQFVKSGGLLYFDEEQKQAIAENIQPKIRYPYVYPPYSVLFFAPLGFFSYESGKYIFIILQLVIWVGVLRNRAVRELWPAYGQLGYSTPFLFLLSSPFVINTVLTGQLGIFFASVMLLGIAWLDNAPKRAGIILSLLAIKPTLAIALPFYFIASKRWKIFAYFGFCTMIYAAISISLWGIAPWVDWLQSSTFLASIFVRPQLPDNFMSQMISVYAAIRMLGGGTGMAWIAQIVVALSVVVTLIAVTLRKVDKNIVFSVLLISPLLMNAYVWQYDAVVVAIVILLLLEQGFNTPHTLLARLVMIATIFSPMVALQLQAMGIPFGALVTISLLLIVYRTGATAKYTCSINKMACH